MGFIKLIIQTLSECFKPQVQIDPEEEKERLRAAGLKTESKFELTEEELRELEELEEANRIYEETYGKDEPEEERFVIPKKPSLADAIKELMEEEDEVELTDEELGIVEEDEFEGFEDFEKEKKNPFDIPFDDEDLYL